RDANCRQRQHQRSHRHARRKSRRPHQGPGDRGVADMNAPGQESADSRLSWLATRRYGFRPAPPGGLALVQDFLNTRAHADKGPDLLGDAEHANAWAANAIRNWSALRGTQPTLLVLTDDDAGRLRELRDVLDTVLTGSRNMPP